MATSTSTDDTQPAPREAMLSSIGEQVAAIDELVGYARMRLQVFDTDMSWGGWASTARVDAVRAFLRAAPGARLEIILHDTRWLETASGRFVMLLRQFPHAVTVYRTGSEAASAMDPLVIVDRAHCLHRFHIDQPRASLMISQPAAVQSLATRFDEIWATGESAGMSGTVLGL